MYIYQYTVGSRHFYYQQYRVDDTIHVLCIENNYNTTFIPVR